MKRRVGFNNVIFRTSGEIDRGVLKKGLITKTEWDINDQRIHEPVWEERYNYEVNIISEIIEKGKYKTILELGPGPGVLCSKLSSKYNDLEYHLVDIEAAKETNKRKNLGGIFHVQNLDNTLDTTHLPKKIDLFIANDFLEHVQNPSSIIQKVKSLLDEHGKVFISVPNWRMGHEWIYRGVFDWDNFIYFMWQHGFEFIDCQESNLKCQPNPRTCNETSMPEEMINSWNWYMLFKRNDIDKEK